MNKKKELLKNTIIIFLGKACTQLISFLLLPLYTGYLSTADYGIVDLITIVGFALLRFVAFLICVNTPSTAEQSKKFF